MHTATLAECRKGNCCMTPTVCSAPAPAQWPYAEDTVLCSSCQGESFLSLSAVLVVPLATIRPLSQRQRLIFYHWDFLPCLLYPPGVNKLLQVSSNYAKRGWTHCAQHNLFTMERGAVRYQLEAPSFIKTSFASHQQSRSSKPVGCHIKV